MVVVIGVQEQWGERRGLCEMSGTFYQWLLAQAGRNDPIGDLASDCKDAMKPGMRNLYRGPIWQKNDNPSLRDMYQGLRQFEPHITEALVAAFREWQKLGNTYRNTVDRNTWGKVQERGELHVYDDMVFYEPEGMSTPPYSGPPWWEDLRVLGDDQMRSYLRRKITQVLKANGVPVNRRTKMTDELLLVFANEISMELRMRHAFD